MRPTITLALALLVGGASAFGAGSSTQHVKAASVVSFSSSASPYSRVSMSAVPMPAGWEQPAWLPELQACCSLAKASGEGMMSSDERMGGVLEWLQTMLVQIELGDEDDELDEDFVATARPWLHTKAFHDVACDSSEFASRLWEFIGDADYLGPEGSGGTLLLLLPTQLPLSLFDTIVASVGDGVRANLNANVLVFGCHPDADKVSQKTPVPLIRLFLDSPDLLVEGGSMGDAAGFL